MDSKHEPFLVSPLGSGRPCVVLVDADARTKAPAFDHARLAASLSTAAVGRYTAVTLPFSTFSFVDDDRAIEFRIGPPPGAGRGDAAAGVDGATWRCTLDAYNCRRPDTDSRGGRGRGGRGGGLGGPVRALFEINGAEPRKSPDGKLEALVNNYNLAIREVGKRAVTWLTTDGSEGAYYDPESLAWSPDSTRIAIDKVTPGYRRYVHYVESSPEDQLQPKDSTMQDAKPGDVLDVDPGRVRGPGERLRIIGALSSFIRGQPGHGTVSDFTDGEVVIVDEHLELPMGDLRGTRFKQRAHGPAESATAPAAAASAPGVPCPADGGCAWSIRQRAVHAPAARVPSSSQRKSSSFGFADDVHRT